MTLNDIALSENHELYIHDLCLSCILNEIGIINSVKDGSWNESSTYNSVLSYFNRLGFSTDITISEDQYSYIPSSVITCGDPVGEPGAPGIAIDYKTDYMPIYMKLDTLISPHMSRFIFGSFGDPTLMKYNKKYSVYCSSPLLHCLLKEAEIYYVYRFDRTSISIPTITKIKYAFTGVYRNLEELCNDLIKFIIIYLLINFVLEEYGNNLQREFSSINPGDKYTFADKSLKVFTPFCSIQEVSKNYNDLIKYLFNNKQLLKFYKYKLSQL